MSVHTHNEMSVLGSTQSSIISEEMYEIIQRRVAEEGLALNGDAESIARVATIIRTHAGIIGDSGVFSIIKRLREDTVGVGKLEALLAHPGVTDVLVNGPNSVWVDSCGLLEPTSVCFSHDEQVRQLATRLILSCGRRIDDAHPYADGRLLRPDGSSLRVHAVLSPPATQGTCISLRVLRNAEATLEELYKQGTISNCILRVLQAIVHAKKSFLIVGGTGTGKTTLLSAMLGEIPHDQRVLTIEDTAELSPCHPHVVSLVARSANAEGSGEINLSELLKQGLRMRPDRIVVGEIRGKEVIDLLSALNTGHEGGAGTVHANSITEVPARLEALAALGGMKREALAAQATAAIHYVIAMRRKNMNDGVMRREVHQIGLIERDPFRVITVWDSDKQEKSVHSLAFRDACTDIGCEIFPEETQS